ncbi:hypothetical protein ACVW00_001140 [Marmoricola sp. URHA0025 HA25]
MNEQTGAPNLTIINADATPEEVAAVVAVFAALQAPPTEDRRPRHEWAAHTRKMRTTLRRGPGAWRASGLPHQ